MHTARLLTVSPSMHCAGGVCSVGGLLLGGCLFFWWWVSASGGCLLLGGGGVVSQHALRQTPPCEQNSWHTLLKILPCPKLRLRALTRKWLMEYLAFGMGWKSDSSIEISISSEKGPGNGLGNGSWKGSGNGHGIGSVNGFENGSNAYFEVLYPLWVFDSLKTLVAPSTHWLVSDNRELDEFWAVIAGSLEAAYSLTWGAQEIWGKGGGETLALLW